MTELTDEAVKLADDCTLAAKCMEDTDTFPTGQAILREAARAILATRAELAQARADAQAAVALVVERAAKVPRLHAKQLQQNGLTAMSSDFDHIEEDIRALAPADGLATVEALRATADGYKHAAEGFAAELAAAKQRETDDADLILDAYKALLVLHRICDKSGLIAGADAANNIADRIVAAHPECWVEHHFAPPSPKCRRAIKKEMGG